MPARHGPADPKLRSRSTATMRWRFRRRGVTWRASFFDFAHVLVGKPVPTFRSMRSESSAPCPARARAIRRPRAAGRRAPRCAAVRQSGHRASRRADRPPASHRYRRHAGRPQCSSPVSPPASSPASRRCISRSARVAPSALSKAAIMRAGTSVEASRLPSAMHASPCATAASGNACAARMQRVLVRSGR